MPANDFTVSMRLIMLDEASAQLRGFITALENLRATTARVGASLDGVAVGVRAIGTAASAGSGGIGGFSAALGQLGAALGVVRAGAAGTSATISNVGVRATATAATAAALSSAVTGLAAALQNAVGHLTGAAAGLQGVNAAARAAGAGVGLAGQQMATAGQHMAGVTRQASVLGDTMKGLVAIWAAFKIEQFGKAAVGEAAEFQLAEARLKSLNRPEAENQLQLQRAAETSRSLGFVSQREALDARLAAIGGTAETSPELIDRTMKEALQAAILARARGDKSDIKDVVANLYGLAEMRGLTSRPEEMTGSFDFAQRVLTAAGGKLSLKDMETVTRQVKYGGGAMLDEEGWAQVYAFANQLKAAGRGGGGGGSGVSQAGTATTQLLKWAEIGPKNKETVRLMRAMGLIADESQLREDESDTTMMNVGAGAIDAEFTKLALQRPLQAIRDILGPRMLKLAQDNPALYPGTMEEGLAKLAIQMTAGQGGVNVGNAIAQAILPGPSGRLEAEARLTREAKHTPEALRDLDETYWLKVQKFDAALDNLYKTIGEKLLPVITPLIEKFAALVDGLNKFSSDHPALTLFNSIVAAIGAIGAALYGIGALVGFEVIAAGLAAFGASAMAASGGVIALSVALAGVAGWNIGTWIADMEAGGAKLSDWLGAWGAFYITQWENILIRVRDTALNVMPGVGIIIKAALNIGNAEDLIKANNEQLASNLKASGFQINKNASHWTGTIETLRDTPGALQQFYGGYVESPASEAAHHETPEETRRKALEEGAAKLGPSGAIAQKTKQIADQSKLLKDQETLSIEAARAEEKRTLAALEQATQLAKAAAARKNDLQEVARLESQEAGQVVAIAKTRMQAELQAVNESTSKRIALEKDAAAKVQEIEIDASKKRIGIWQDYYNGLKKQADEALKAYEDSAKRVLELDKQIKQSRFEGDVGVRELQRGGMSETEAYYDKQAELAELVQQARSAAELKDYDAFQEANNLRKQRARELANAPAGMDKEAARADAISAFRGAVDDQTSVLQAKKRDAEAAGRTQLQTLKTLQEQMAATEQQIAKLNAMEIKVKATVDEAGLVQSAKAARDSAQAVLDANPLQIRTAGGAGGGGGRAGQATGAPTSGAPSGTAKAIDVGPSVDVVPPGPGMGVPADNLPRNAPQSGWAWVDAILGTKPTQQSMIDFYNTPSASISKDQVGNYLDQIVPADWVENIATFAIGTDYVPRTGLAMLHEGEAIIPASQNRAANMQPMNLTFPGMGTFPVLAEQNVANQMQDVLMRERLRWS